MPVPPVVSGPPTTPGALTVKTTAVPYTGPAVVLGQSKHLCFARLGNRWYKLCGDHAGIDKATTPPMQNQDGRQEVLSVNFAANDWTKETPYYLPTGVQQAYPDDAFCVERKGEGFVFVSATANPEPPIQPPGVALQLWGRITAFNPATKQYRDVAPYPKNPNGEWTWGGNRAWRGTYDDVRDRFVIPVVRNELEWIEIDGATGADLTLRSSSGYPREFGNYKVRSAGIVGEGRTRYVYDQYSRKLFEVNLDTKAMTLFWITPGAPAPISGGSTQSIAWHPGKRVVAIAHANKDQVGTLHLFEVDSAKVTNLNNPAGFMGASGVYVPPSTMFHDPDTDDIVCVGGIDWDGMKSPVYWRLTIQ